MNQCLGNSLEMLHCDALPIDASHHTANKFPRQMRMSQCTNLSIKVFTVSSSSIAISKRHANEMRAVHHQMHRSSSYSSIDSGLEILMAVRSAMNTMQNGRHFGLGQFKMRSRASC